jgi:protein-disulfide isomerase
MISNVKLSIPVNPDDHMRGPSDAPLTLVEYGDFECPYSGKAHGIVMRLLQTFKNDLRFVYRHFPLPMIHPHSMDAARAAEAAGMQGKFWEMYRALYEHQQELHHENLLEFAQSLKLDTERLARDMESSEVEARIAEDVVGGKKSGVESTPCLFINNFRYEGDWSYQSLLTFLIAVRTRLADHELKKAG